MTRGRRPDPVEEGRMTAIEWGRDLDTAVDRGRKERTAVFLYFGKDP